jgi:ribonucleoside-diphosphate reductase alpha chain
MALQYGVPLITLVDKFRHARFEPAGMTSNRDIPFAKSLIDYIFCWLGCQFIPGYADKNTPHRGASASAENKNTTTAKKLVEKTKDLTQKIAEAKAIRHDDKKPRGEGIPPLNRGEVAASKNTKNRFASLASRIGALVGSGVTDESVALQAEVRALEQFNAQFAHFLEDAPACDICGSITVRNGTCYKCFNCGNSMGCS